MTLIQVLWKKRKYAYNFHSNNVQKKWYTDSIVQEADEGGVVMKVWQLIGVAAVF